MIGRTRVPPTVEKQTWNILEGPVIKLGAWLKEGGA